MDERIVKIAERLIDAEVRDAPEVERHAAERWAYVVRHVLTSADDLDAYFAAVDALTE